MAIPEHTPEPRRTIDTVLGPIKVVPECDAQAVCVNGLRCWEAGVCLHQPERAAPDADEPLRRALHRIAFPGEYEGSSEWSRAVAFEALKETCSDHPKGAV